MAIPKSNQKAVAKYMKNNYDEIKIRVLKGDKEIIKAHADAKNETTNEFIKRAIHETIGREGAEKISILQKRCFLTCSIQKK
ncbi:MAG: ABC transporter ATP-binding protein [Oscillospiraceae bacterium]|nr:ABC transporter ATP-binding protein [Oscillospiraceae bacterium]